MDSKDHVEKLEGGGAMCRHCGGEVGDDGMALDLDADDPGTAPEVQDSIEKQENPLDATFASAVRKGLNSKMRAE